MNRIIRFLVFSDVWVGISVFCFTWLTFNTLGFVDWSYMAWVFFSTVAAYNYMRIIDKSDVLPTDEFGQRFWLMGHIRQAWFFTILFSVVALYFFYKIYSPFLLLLVLGVVFISLWYPLSFGVKKHSFTALRNIPGLKLLLISICWSWISFAVPVIMHEAISFYFVLEFIFRTLLVAALVIPFDIRDLNEDTFDLKTIPQRIGILKSRLWALAIVLAYLVWKVIFIIEGNYTTIGQWGWVLGLLLVFIIMRNMHKKQALLYCGFWVEASPIIIALCVKVFQSIPLLH